MKPGWKTSEFWLCLLVVVIPVGLSMVDADSPVARVLGSVLATLTALGYTAARARMKLVASAEAPEPPQAAPEPPAP